MAASSLCTRFLVSKSSLSSLKSAVRHRNHFPLPNASATMSPQRSSTFPSNARRFPPSIRSCVYQLGCLPSLLPLHSAVATARMISYLSIDSRSCQALSMGNLCCNHRGP